jgi:hypothetical protein
VRQSLASSAGRRTRQYDKPDRLRTLARGAKNPEIAQVLLFNPIVVVLVIDLATSTRSAKFLSAGKVSIALSNRER